MNLKKYQRLVEEGEKLFREKQFEKAAKLFEDAFQIATTVQDLNTLGFIYIELGRLGLAEDLFYNSLDLSENARSYYGLAVLNERLGKIEEAIKYYEKALKLDGNNLGAHFDCAYLYDDIKNYEKAKEHYLKVIELDPNEFWAHINIGSIYEKENKDDEALRHFLKAYRIDNKKPMVCYNLGVVYNKLKNYDLALKYYLKELELENHYEYTYFNLGILYKDGFRDYEKAKFAYLKGLEENKDNYFIWYNLGCVYALLNDYDNAYDCFIMVFYKDKKLFAYIKVDEELEAFRASSQYQKIIGLDQ